jgi:hypothetical protein
MSAMPRIRTLYRGFCLLCLAMPLSPLTANAEDLASFCERLPRAAYAALEKHPASNDWFQVYEVDKNIYAIYEPWQWQEVISYLIVGTDHALLFDSGNGIGDIRAVVDQLTDQPITVLNSHTHFDHIGGNYQFDHIWSVSTPFSIANSKGVDNEMVKTEASPEALCHGLPEGVTQANHRIQPFTIVPTVSCGPATRSTKARSGSGSRRRTWLPTGNRSPAWRHWRPGSRRCSRLITPRKPTRRCWWRRNWPSKR